MQALESATDVEALLAEMERKYMWWRPVSGGLHAKNRIIAQVMNLGTYDDIRRLEQIFGRAALAEII